MIPRFYENGSAGTLACPKCGADEHSGNLHHHTIELWQRRREDDPPACVTVTVGGRFNSNELPLRDCPSYRRDGIRIWFDCECCAMPHALTIAQHKGDTLVEWEKEL